MGEIIREKIFQQYREEVPYCSSVGPHNPALIMCFCPDCIQGNQKLWRHVYAINSRGAFLSW